MWSRMCFYNVSPVYPVMFGGLLKKIFCKDNFEPCTKWRRNLSLKRRGIFQHRIVSSTRACSFSVVVKKTKKYFHSFKYCAAIFFIQFRTCVGKLYFFKLLDRFPSYCGCFHTLHVFLYKYIETRRIRNKNDVYRSKRLGSFLPAMRFAQIFQKHFPFVSRTLNYNEKYMYVYVKRHMYVCKSSII